MSAIRSSAAAIFLASALVAPVLGQAPAAAPAAPAAAAPASAKPIFAESVPLTEEKLKTMFTAVKDLRTESAKIQQPHPLDAQKPISFAQEIVAFGGASAVLKKHGFASVAEFQKVVYSAAIAHTVNEAGGKKVLKEKISAAKKQSDAALEQLRKQLPEAQAQAIASQMTVDLLPLGDIDSVPDANLELVKKHSTEMKKLGN